MMNWLRNEEGQGMVEYGLILGLIALVAIVSLIALGPKIKNLFKKASEDMDVVTSEFA
ncbi:MAG TPA: Flp family type IVb pilin [Clostridia bacterium]|nr:Flp family type IVb pilin [Clostridia bacterium]